MAAKEEVWGDYRFAVIADNQATDGLKAIDLGAGHSSSNETLSGRVIATLKSEALLNESVGAGYIERNWPPALKDSGAWPLASLRQSFLNGALTRLIDPDAVLRTKIVEFVSRGDFGLGSGQRTDGSYERLHFKEMLPADEVSFDAGVFLLRKDKAAALISGEPPSLLPEPSSGPAVPIVVPTEPIGKVTSETPTRTLRLVGTIPPELWNRLGSKIIPKLRSGDDLRIGIDLSVSIATNLEHSLKSDLRQVLEELGLIERVRVE
ncbi:MAG TPA: hypothetical protein VK416_03875 [Thermoanaerobaculia bacterium]|nr:hypothetical protein [Thermoanaerobaculia bacterium]